MAKIDLLQYEKQKWAAGQQVLGIDESGYGTFAGNLIVAGVSFDPLEEIPNELKTINDSKKLSEVERFRLEPLIKSLCAYWFVVEATAAEINETENIYWLRFNLAEDEIRSKYLEKVKGNTVVYDGNKALRLNDIDCNSEFLVKGDGKSFSIAAASILAKTVKDREMIAKAELYPEYGFEKNKGYHSKAHSAALKKYGMCPEHRHKYCRNHI